MRRPRVLTDHRVGAVSPDLCRLTLLVAPADETSVQFTNGSDTWFSVVPGFEAISIEAEAWLIQGDLHEFGERDHASLLLAG